ncbi:MAG: hypothetical protein AB7U83_03845 [Vicinamibacterales bacterium]
MAAPVAIVAGYLAGNPVGGHVLSILHWLSGLRRLGYDVVFVEHHGWADACWNPRTRTLSDDCSYGLVELSGHARRLGLRGWCFVDRQGGYHGLRKDELAALCRDADVLVGLWTVTWLDAFAACRRRLFIDTDPGFTQFAMTPGVPAAPGYASPFDFHEHYSYGTRIGQPDCPIPTHGLTWKPLRPPVDLDVVAVRETPAGASYTTVMAWSSRPPVVYEGVEYGQKDVEFWKIAALPSVSPVPLEIALGGRAPYKAIREAGWRLADAAAVTATPWTYLDYIAGSRGEFSVAVNLEVKTRSGWFSDRTAAYLASGKPAVVQDTGFSADLPCGEGLLAFTTVDEAAAAIAEVERDYPRHARAARRIAEQHLDARRIVARVLAGG